MKEVLITSSVLILALLALRGIQPEGGEIYRQAK